MTVILDVSGITQILFKKEKGNKFTEVIKKAAKIIAPDLYISELTNTLWKYYKAKLLTKEMCDVKIEEGINFIDDFISSNDLWKEAFGEGIKNDHPIYDMYYAVLARRNNGKLITNDERLAKICKNSKIDFAF
jgi:predicted nucleic acid-binding protein